MTTMGPRIPIWALGRGEIDFARVFALMRDQAPAPVYTVEAHDKNDIEESLLRIRKFLQAQETA